MFDCSNKSLLQTAVTAGSRTGSWFNVACAPTCPHRFPITAANIAVIVVVVVVVVVVLLNRPHIEIN